MTYGHLPAILNLPGPDRDAKQKSWEAINTQWWPKFIQGYTKTSEYAARIYNPFTKAEERKRYIKTMKESNYKILPGIFWVFSKESRDTLMSPYRDEVLMPLQKELREIIPEVAGYYSRFLPDDNPNMQYTFFVPDFKTNDTVTNLPVGNAKNSLVVSNFNGKAIFLAYLIHKGFVTEKDLPLVREVFGHATLKVAQSKEWQNAVREKLNEPLLPAKDRNF